MRFLEITGGEAWCPVCSETMLILEFGGVEIDRCDRCAGAWLDAGELGRILEGGGGRDRLHEALTSAAETQKTGRACPRCRQPMRGMKIEADPHVLVERCPRGHGLWFDRNELSRVLRSFAPGSAVAGFLADVCREGPLNRTADR